MPLTQLSPIALPWRRYGSFSRGTAGDRLTQLSPMALPGRRYGSFAGKSGFPAQYAGLRYFSSTVKELCMVALADAPAGNQWRIVKNGTTYAVYLVETTDPNASGVRINTAAGIKAARLKT